MADRITLWHVSQLERRQTACASFTFATKISQKRRFRSLVCAKPRHNFLTKTPDNVHQCTVRHAVQRVSSHPFHPVWALWKAPVRVAQEVIGGGETNADDVPVPY